MAPETRPGAGPAARARKRVCTYEQEMSSLGINVLLDDLCDFEGQDKDVLAEQAELQRCQHLINPPGLDVRRLSLPDLEVVTTEHACACLKAGPVRSVCPKAGPSRAARVGRKEAPDDLDPTQRQFYDWMVGWASQLKENGGALPAGAKPLRMQCLGTAGAGKSAAMRLAVDAVRDILGEEAVAVCVHTLALPLTTPSARRGR